MFTLLNLNMR